jgi:catechol 2,3-dioxygenase-like lactoylglutathione lyase family enzyme
MNGKSAITSPVVRLIQVAGIPRSSEFYRDILGFEIRENADGPEAISGPARIRFADRRFADPHDTSPAVLFFQAAGIAEFHARISDRGGNPSAIQRVNWIKMSTFEIRDPDGHVLWFGESYHEEEVDSPSRRRTQPHGMRQALPELPCDDVAAAVAYYRDVLGFKVNYQQHDLGVMDRDAITILLISRTERHTGIGSFEVYIDDADALYAELSKQGANIQTQPVSRPWGLRDFCILDCEGNRITFAQTFE